MRDWTTCVGYAQSIVVPPASSVAVLLYPIPDYSGSNAEFLVEDEEEQSLFLERIVGQVFASPDEDFQAGAFTWRLMPLGVDYDTGAALWPFTLVSLFGSSESANLRWWAERCWVPVTTGSSSGAPEAIEHPYWTTVDVHPRNMLGAKKNLWPFLVLDNSSGNVSLRVFHRLRAFWK